MTGSSAPSTSVVRRPSWEMEMENGRGCVMVAGCEWSARAGKESACNLRIATHRQRRLPGSKTRMSYWGRRPSSWSFPPGLCRWRPCGNWDTENQAGERTKEGGDLSYGRKFRQTWARSMSKPTGPEGYRLRSHSPRCLDGVICDAPKGS